VKVGDFGFTKRLKRSKETIKVGRITHPRWVAPEVSLSAQCTQAQMACVIHSRRLGMCLCLWDVLLSAKWQSTHPRWVAPEVRAQGLMGLCAVVCWGLN
jgi:hypothetical protein